MINLGDFFPNAQMELNLDYAAPIIKVLEKYSNIEIDVDPEKEPAHESTPPDIHR